MVLPVGVVLPVLVVLVVVLVVSQAFTLVLVIRRNRSYSKLVEATNLLIDDIDQARFERLLSPVSMNELEAELFGTPIDENADEMVRLDSSDALGADEASHAELLSAALTAHATRSALVTDEFVLPVPSEVAATLDLPAPAEVASASPDPVSPAALGAESEPIGADVVPAALEPTMAAEATMQPAEVVAFEQPAAVSKRTDRVPPPIVTRQPVAQAEFDDDAEYGSAQVTQDFVHRNGFDPSRFGPAEIVVVPSTAPPTFASRPAVELPVLQPLPPVIYSAPPQTAPTFTAAQPAPAPQRPAPHQPPPPQYQQPAPPPQYQQPAAPQFHAGVQHGTAPLRHQAPPPAAPAAVPVMQPLAPGDGQQHAAPRPVTPPRTAPRRDSVHAEGFNSIEEMAVSAVIDGGRPVPQVAQTLRVSTALVAYWVSKSGRTRAR